jgi:predicted XRE-type DNA-binding protein
MNILKNSARKSIIARDGRELASLLDITDEDSAALELRVTLLKKIIAEVAKQDLTHLQVATLTGGSRSRMTAILNGAIHDVSTDHLLRTLAALGIRTRVSFKKAA